MSVNYFRVINCEVEGTLPHEWEYESVYGEFDYYGVGTMEQRRCLKCQAIDYIRFTSEDGYTTDIITLVDEDFEKLCQELEKDGEPNDALMQAFKHHKDKFEER
jgi:hypothetical protein